VKNNPIPTAERSWGIWSKVNEENYIRLQSINEEAAAKKAEPDSDWQKIGDFWKTAMDTITIEKLGMAPLKSELDKIDAIKNIDDLINEAGYLQSIGPSPLFNPNISQDEKNSDKMSLHFYQGGLGLPDRDFYFENDDRTKNIRAEYVVHLQKMFSLIGNDSATAKKNAATVMQIETGLAEKSRKLADLRDPEKNYNKMSAASLAQLTPLINWKNLMSAYGVISFDTVIVGQPEFFNNLESLLKKYSIDDWKTYLKIHLVHSYAPYLSKPFAQENFNFYGTVMNGTKEQRPRWKRILDLEGGLMGFMLGKLYIERYYSPEIKARYDKMVDNVLAAYHERLDKLTWMSDSTKKKAHAKLNTVVRKVGYPDKWRDYSAMKVSDASFLQNVKTCIKWANDYQIAKLNKPIDRTEWDMTPQTWNAYYNPSNNEIVLPAAAFVVPGMADSCVDDAIMYGYAAGSTIGHEITHGFDDQGSQFDEKGNLREWWSKEDRTKFVALTKGIVNQFNGYTIPTGEHLNGDAEQGENIADLGGMLLGLDAFKKTEQYKEGKLIGGFTPVQRYFIGFALSWYGKVRNESLQTTIKTDVHAPNYWRVNGPVTNIDEFYSAFGVKPGDKMYKPENERVKIW
ncbi:MAG: M13 family metallopeptidase, partial [Bacteroidetes bacterium]|nr:M13 family metallopeptidase [Bacteroidota bacterium]